MPAATVELDFLYKNLVDVNLFFRCVMPLSNDVYMESAYTMKYNKLQV